MVVPYIEQERREEGGGASGPPPMAAHALGVGSCRHTPAARRLAGPCATCSYFGSPSSRLPVLRLGAWKVWNEPEAVPVSTWQRWYDTVDAARERLKIVDELIAEEGQLAGAAENGIARRHMARRAGRRGVVAVAGARAVKVLTGIDIADPVALLAVELPGFATYVEVAASSTLPASARTMTVPGGRFESGPPGHRRRNKLGTTARGTTYPTGYRREQACLKLRGPRAVTDAFRGNRRA